MLPMDSFRDRQRVIAHFWILMALLMLLFPAWYTSFVFSPIDSFSFSKENWIYPPLGFGIIYIPIPSCYPNIGSWAGTDLPVARLTFARAKSVDIAWNWVVGRGLQMALIFLTIRIFGDGLLKVIEEFSMPIEMIASLSLFATRIRCGNFCWPCFVYLDGASR